MTDLCLVIGVDRGTDGGDQSAVAFRVGNDIHILPEPFASAFLDYEASRAIEHQPTVCTTCGERENLFCSNAFHMPKAEHQSTDRVCKPVSGKQPIETAPKGVPVIVAGGIAMQKTGGEWFTGMETPLYERPLQWKPKWWMPIPTNDAGEVKYVD